MLKRKVFCSDLVLSEQAILFHSKSFFFNVVEEKMWLSKVFSPDLALNQILKCQNFEWPSSEVQPIPWHKARRKPT